MAAPTVSGGFPTSVSAVTAERCAYCAEPLQGLRAVERLIAGHPSRYCCLGCAFIAEELAAWAPAAAPSAPQTGAGVAWAYTQLEIRGMVCTACAALLAHRLRRAAGVRSVHVDFIARRAFLVFDPALADRERLAAAVAGAGYRVPDNARPGGERRAERLELLRVLVAWLAMMQVMMLAFPSYVAGAGEIPGGIEQMLRIGQLVLSTPVAFFCAQPFWRAAASQLRARAIGMDVPVALGLATALAASVWATVRGSGAVYFDSVTMFTALLLAVRRWQARAMARTTVQLDAAAQATRLRARRLVHAAVDTTSVSVDAAQLEAGDHVMVPVGELIPADGRILEGSTRVSQAWLTGESAPLERGAGESVLAGSLNVGRPVIVEVVRAGDATSLAVLQRLVVEAASRRPADKDLAARIARGFAPALLGICALTALFWLALDPGRALDSVIAVLVVTCPCALSLAAPLATAVAQVRLARAGVLLARPAALEALARADSVVFDKTGTLTGHVPVLLECTPLGGRDADACLALAAALEAHSLHPFARATQEAARRLGLAPARALRVAEEAGMGVEASVGGVRYRLGSAAFVRAVLGPAARRPDAAAQDAVASGASTAWLAAETGMLARLRFGEVLRPRAPQLVRALRGAGLEVSIASGDAPAPVRAAAEALAERAAEPVAWRAGQTPSDKRAHIEALQAAGHRVVMVGDGLNDAPVIAQADASIALASGSQLAQVRADVIVPDEKLELVGAVFALARRTAHTVRGNFAWALLYNLTMVPLAAAGQIAPWVASAGMAASAAIVLANSLRLRGPGKDAGGAG